MKYAVIADIHANLEALEVVLEDIDSLPIDRIICLGDIVGYGANPNECCELIFNENGICIIGNHDYAAINIEEADNYNALAYKSALWTYNNLEEKHKDIFRGLRDTRIIDEDFIITHSALTGRNDYIVSHYAANDNMDKLKALYSSCSVCFYGHTHIKRLWECCCQSSNNSSNNSAVDILEACLSNGSEYYLNKDNYYLINPGGLGQPRDGDNRASYLIFDSDNLSIHYRALSYDFNKTKDKIYRAGLPHYSADRLFYGV